MNKPLSVLFVCLGNICRSPTAHAVFAESVRSARLESSIDVDSAGTGDWHIGHPPDRRAQEYAKRRNYDLSELRARQVVPADFGQFDYILAMDKQNLADLEVLRPQGSEARLSLFLDFLPSVGLDVPDPYYGGDAGFDRVLDLVEQASAGLLEHIRTHHSL